MRYKFYTRDSAANEQTLAEVVVDSGKDPKWIKSDDFVTRMLDGFVFRVGELAGKEFDESNTDHWAQLPYAFNGSRFWVAPERAVATKTLTISPKL